MSTGRRDNVLIRSIGKLCRSIMGRFSRVTSHGDASIHSMVWGELPRATNHSGGPFDSYDYAIREFQHPQFQPPEDPFVVQDEWAFLRSSEQQKLLCSSQLICLPFRSLKLSEQEHKFVYLHAPEYHFTRCKEILLSELVKLFLDVKFVRWEHLQIEESVNCRWLHLFTLIPSLHALSLPPLQLQANQLQALATGYSLHTHQINGTRDFRKRKLLALEMILRLRRAGTCFC